MSTKTKKESKQKRYEVFGFPITSVLRRMGKAHMSFDEAQAALASHKVEPAEATIRIQLAAGKSGKRGEPAKLTGDQLAELKAVGKAAVQAEEKEAATEKA